MGNNQYEMQHIVAWVRNNDAGILTDEQYERIILEPTYARWRKVAPDLADRTVVVNGLSKA